MSSRTPTIRRMPAYLGLVIAAHLLASSPAAAQAQLMRIYYPDIEQGSSTLIVSPTGHALLIDAGTGIKSTDEGPEDLINDLIDAGIVTSLDYTMATHYDEDHIGRFENVFQFVPMPPSAIAYDRGEWNGTPNTFAYSDYSFGASQHNRTTVTPCTTLDLGGGVTVSFETINGQVCGSQTVDVTTSSQFENSAVVSAVVRYGDVDVWIGGDLTGNIAKGVSDVESVVGPQVGDVDVYTFNHHGSETSSTLPFLSDLKAEVGLIQNSVSNGFGHPRAVVVNGFLGTPATLGNTPMMFQQNRGNPNDPLSDDSLATAIADCDDVDTVIGLPGTVMLMSDGSSYRIHACGIAATTLKADSGPGTIGDYPPAIRRVARTPLVPLASEGVNIEADVEDVASAEIRYSVNGVEQTPIAMTHGAGVTWAGTIPAQLDGARVRLRVAATDSSAQIEVSSAQGYFSGITPIATLRINDAAGVLVPKRYGARVQGNMTAEPGVFHPFVTQSYVQDATGGVQIFDPTFLTLARGDVAQFVGEVEQFGGQTELSLAEAWGNYGYTRIGAGTAPAPQVVSVAQVGEALEGKLLRINGLTVVSGVIPESGAGSLTVSDDGGISTLVIHVDENTDIPGANTPTQTFDVVGVASQFDSWVPFNSGYQLLPRERTDFISNEVNHPALLISEIYADPAGTISGDANGDGVRSATADEFVELTNTSFAPLDISGYTVSDAVQLRFTFPSGTVIPAREATVVFGGGTPTGVFGNAMANGLVFKTGSAGLSLNNTAETVTLKDNLGNVVQSVTYGNEGNFDQALVRDPDYSNAPFVKHAVAVGSGATLFSPGARINGQAFTVPPGAVLLTEVMYDPSGADGGLEWVELHNTTAAPISLSDMCVGAGGLDWTSILIGLSGSIPAGATFVVGGPVSSSSNGNPVFDLAADITPDLQNSGADADGVALFNFRCTQVKADTVPVDAVVYGVANSSGLIDETGIANAPDVGDAPGGASIERADAAGAWQITSLPNPNFFSPGNPPPPPPPSSGELILTEVFYDAASTDNGYEWVEIYNPGSTAVDLSGWSLGWGGSDYTDNAQLAGTVQPGQTFVVGGDLSDASNGNPIFNQVLNFSPDLQNSGTVGDGVALFNLPASQVTATTVPVDAVVYGPNNNSGLIDETGVANAPEVGDAAGGSSIQRIDVNGNWQISSIPAPNAL